MSGPTTTTHDSLVDIWNVKIGHNDAYASASDLEQKILKAVLGEGATATSIDDFKSVASALATDSATHKTATISGEDLQVTQHFKYRNAVVLADYLQNDDANADNVASSGQVAIKSGTTQSAQSKILADSSAFENASVKFTVTDPYAVAGASGNFSSTDEVFTGHFAQGDANYRFTRNVNANCANTAGTASISVTEHTTWNTTNYGVVGAGPAFVNGSVSLNSEGAPVASLYGNTVADNSYNILSSVYVGTSGLGFDVSYNTNNGEPVVGRYALNWVAGEAGGSAVPITITENNMSSDLVVVGDKTEYDAFLADTTATVNLSPLPEQGDLYSNTLDPYLSEQNPTQLPGFKFEISSTTAVTGEVLITTTDGFVSPLAIDASQMAFDLKNKYYLEQSVQTAAGAGQYHALLTHTTVVGVDVSNCLTITNGSLDLSGNDAENFEIVDGTESLSLADSTTDGSIEIYNSSPESAYNTSESNFPRAVGGNANLASTCFVHYLASEADYLADVGVLDTADKSIDLSYNITTLVSQTSEDGPTVANKIDRLNGAVAFISTVEGENSAIAASDITFSVNSNTYTDGELTIVDLKCQKKWSDNGIVDGAGVAIAGVAVDVVASNMSAVGVADIVDLRIEASSKSLTQLSSTMRTSFAGTYTPGDNTAPEVGWNLILAGGDTGLKSSLAKQGVISDASIITILGGNNTTVHNLTLDFGPVFTSVDASKFTKFHNKLDITYGAEAQTTYDDEFTYPFNFRSAIDEVPLTQSDYANIPAGKTLFKRVYNELIRVRTAFRFGNYSNLDLITPLINQETTYYILKDSTGKDLPRHLLAGVTLANGDPLLATIDNTLGSARMPFGQFTANFVRDDLKPYTASILKQTDIAGSLAYGASASIDVWYNTPTAISQPGVGDFVTNITLSPSVSSMEMTTFIVHLALANGVDTFTFTGKEFSAAQVDALATKDPAAIDLATATGTALTGSTVYTRGAEGAGQTSSLVGGGYTFTMQNNIYVDIRVVACPKGLFKVVKNGVETTYESISDFNGAPYVKLDSGVRVSGGLKDADFDDAVDWALTNDAIRVNHWAAQGVTDYTRILQLNYEYTYDEGWKGISNKWLRGFTGGSTVTIERTPSFFLFDIAGYSVNSDLHNQISVQGPFSGNLALSSVAGAITMYPSSFGTSKVFPLSINYGTYTIYDRPADVEADATTTTVAAYKTVISNRKGVRIISKSLSTLVCSYSLFYTTTNTLTVHRIADYTSNETDLDNFTQIGQITLSALQTEETNNYIGNVLNIHYLGESALPDLTCFFTIAPAFLKFQAVDHTTITGSSLPFTKVDGTHLLTRYSAVDHSDSDSQSWNPFSGSNVNNMTISAVARTYEQYRGTSVNTVVKFNIGPNNLKIEYATGIGVNEIGAYATVYEDVIPVGPQGTDDDDVKFGSNVYAVTGLGDSTALPTGSLAISLNQSEITNSTMPVVIFDNTPLNITDNYGKFNLVVMLGSHLLTPKEFILEFNAGDCTGLTTYCIDSMVKNGGNLDVTIAKYTNSSGINSDLFKNNVSNGIAVGGSTKQTVTFSTTMTGNLANTLGGIIGTIPGTITGWTTVGSAGNNQDNVIWLKPTSTPGKTALRTALLLNSYIPRSITVFELDDAVRIMDNQGIAVYRVASQGVVYANTLVNHDADNLATLSNAHLLI